MGVCRFRRNHAIGNDMIDRDRLPSNVIDVINAHDRDQGLITIDKNDIDLVDHFHHDENDRYRYRNDVRLLDVRVQVSPLQSQLHKAPFSCSTQSTCTSGDTNNRRREKTYSSRNIAKTERSSRYKHHSLFAVYLLL